MPYLTPGERLAAYLRRTTFRDLSEPKLRDKLRASLIEGQRGDHLLSALDDIAVLNVSRRLISGAIWALDMLGEGPMWESYLTDLVVNEILIDYHNIWRLKDYLRPCAIAASMEISQPVRREILREHGLSCYMCGLELLRRAGTSDGYLQVTIDHVWPRSYGGDSSFYNLLPACGECNNAKSSMPTWSLFRFQSLFLGPHPSAKEVETVGRQVRIAWQLYEAARKIEMKRDLSFKDALIAVGPISDIDLELRRFPTDFFILDNYLERVE